MKGFSTKKPNTRKATYWVACYVQHDEDDPISIQKQQIEYVPGQDKEQLMLKECHKLFKQDPTVWEVLVHQGPNEVPDSGDQIVARLSREKFDGAEELTI